MSRSSPVICIIGAGSAQFTLDLVRDLCLTEGLKGSTVWLVGHVNRQKVNQVRDVGSRYSAEMNADLRFEITYDRREALKQADFVINTARVEPYTPLLQLAFFMDVVRDMEQLCPKAWLIMAANPVFEGCTLMTRLSPVKVVGLCHGFREGMHNIIEVLDLDPAHVNAQAAGINHNVWLNHFFYKGADAYPLLDEWIESRSEEYWKSPAFNDGKLEWGNMSPKAIDMYRFFGLLPIGDTCGHSSPWWYLEDEAIQRRYKFVYEEWSKIYRSHIDTKMEAIRKAAENTSKAVSEFIPPEKSSGHDHINIIDAIANDNPGQYEVNVPNDGAIDGIPDNVVVEIPAVVSGSGIQGLRIGPLPEAITLHIGSAVARMEYLFEAYKTRNENVLAAWLLQDRAMQSLDEAKSRAREMLETAG